jgi:hypothetical protein
MDRDRCAIACIRLRRRPEKPRRISIGGRLASIARLFGPIRHFVCNALPQTGKERGMIQLNSGFTELNAQQLATKVAYIIGQLTGNLHFPAPAPTLAAIGALLATLQTALIMPKGSARQSAIDAARPPLEAAMQQLAGNLEATANGNLAMLGTSGFQLHKESAQTDRAPDAPQNVRLRNMEASGDVQFVFAASGRAKSYQIQTTDDPVNGVWKNYDPVSSSRKVVVHGLPRAKDVWGRVRALGPNNTMSAWSDPATTLVT